MKELIGGDGRRITEIVNRRGAVLFAYDRTFDHLSELDLTEAQLRGVVCQGLMCIGTNFKRADLRNADLYWAMAFEADFSEADLSGASLQGAALQAANFTGANLTSAKLCRDNLGGSTDLRDAIFKDAIVAGTDFTGAEYNEFTVFPKGFDPEAFGMLRTSEPYTRIYPPGGTS